MPAAMVMKWAKEKGMSPKEAERRWKKAKALAAREGRDPDKSDKEDDWKYTVGIFKTMMGKKTEDMIEAVLAGVPVDEVFDSMLG